MARDVQSQGDVAHATDRIAQAASDMHGNALGAGVTLAHGRRHMETAAATSDIVREGDRLQYELGEGPCLDAAWEHRQVYAGAVASDDRWPVWGPRVARELGVRSMLSTRLFTHADRLGALSVYAAEQYAFDQGDREVALLLAAHAAVAVAAAQQIENLKLAIDHRTNIGKALGIIMVRYELDDDQAISVLRRLSSYQNRKLYELALDVLRDVRLPR